MIRALAFILAVAILQVAAFSQTPADRAADAAEAVAARATGTFEAIDPDDEMPSAEEAAAAYAGLPPLGVPAAVPASAPVIIAQPVLSEEPEAGIAAPRGPAVRMIANPVVQALPAAAPVASSPAPAAPAAPRQSGFVIKSILPIEGTIRYGDWFWDESAAPATGTLVVTVDLQARVISAFRDGHEIGTAVVLVGTQSHPTPLGTFPVLSKSREHFSRKYDNAPMPHSLWLTTTGIAIHGSPVMNGYASHGCIGVPDEFAAKLFAATKRGDKVIITRGKMVGVGDKIL